MATASSKDTFENETFAPTTFASGTWRGVGAGGDSGEVLVVPARSVIREFDVRFVVRRIDARSIIRQVGKRVIVLVAQARSIIRKIDDR